VKYFVQDGYLDVAAVAWEHGVFLLDCVYFRVGYHICGGECGAGEWEDAAAWRVYVVGHHVEGGSAKGVVGVRLVD
jgi:hypothetical protein